MSGILDKSQHWRELAGDARRHAAEIPEMVVHAQLVELQRSPSQVLQPPAALSQQASRRHQEQILVHVNAVDLDHQ
jgi:hypothetical protein